MKLIKYKSNHIDEVAQLFYNTVHSVNSKDYSEDELNAWASGTINKTVWNNSFLEHNSIIATENELIVGFGDMSISGYLDRLYVHKDYQRQGIATDILNKLEKTLEKIGVTKFTTYASITAKPFFEAMGYVVIQKNIVIRNDIQLLNYKMEKCKIN
ncbi:MAG: GNAT family N-acetyltransferase [Clostridia bacterium]